MIRYLSLFLLSINLLTSCSAKKKQRQNFKDFVIIGDTISAITTEGQVKVFSAIDGAPIQSPIQIDSGIATIRNDRKGNIIISKDQKIYLVSHKDGSLKSIGKYKGVISATLFDTNNHLYVVTDQGITDAMSKDTWLPDSFRSNLKSGWGMPETNFIDKNDNIWVGFGHGEWGGKLFIFNTAKRVFVKPGFQNDEGILPVISLFEIQDAVYASCGLEHFETSGSIIRFDKFKPTYILASDSYRDTTKTKDGFIHGEYIGPATYNLQDKHIYFYSQNGIFKGDPLKVLSKISSWQRVLQPKLHWRNGQAHAVGSPMNVLKMQFATNGNLLFLTQEDGIGLYDGKKLKLVQ